MEVSSSSRCSLCFLGSLSGFCAHTVKKTPISTKKCLTGGCCDWYLYHEHYYMHFFSWLWFIHADKCSLFHLLFAIVLFIPVLILGYGDNSSWHACKFWGFMSSACLHNGSGENYIKLWIFYHVLNKILLLWVNWQWDCEISPEKNVFEHSHT